MASKGWLWRYSLAVCRRPRLVITSCVAVTLACSLGLFHVRIITNPDLIWVPPNSLANRQKEFFDDAFSPFFRINQVFFVAESAADGVDVTADMIAPQYLQRVMSVQRAIESATFTSASDGQTSSFDALCFKPIEGEGCLVESPSQYWLHDPVLLAEDDSPSLTAACQTTQTFLASRSPCMDEIGTPVMREVVFGDIGVNTHVKSPDPCGGSVPAAGALVLTFLLNNYQDAEHQQLAEQWEKEVFLAIVDEAGILLKNDVQAPMKVSYMSQRSVADSLSVEAGENAWVLVVSYLCMFLYVSLILGDPCHAVRSRYSLALTGIIIVVASLATTIGILSMFGVGTTLIVWEVVPFLTLAIGVDNMVILSREFDRLETAPEFEANTSASCGGKSVPSKSIGASGPTYAWFPPGSLETRKGRRTAEARLEERLGAAVSKVAPSILGAASCEAVAFLVGALTDIPALRQFCLVAATAVAVGFVLQVTWFMAALSLDARRVSQGRLDLAPWVTPGKKRKRPVWPPAPSEHGPIHGDADGMSVPLLHDRQPNRPPVQFPSTAHTHSAGASTAALADAGDSAVLANGVGRDGAYRGSNSEHVRFSAVEEDDAFLRLRQRSLTSEFGAGSDANPALFFSTSSSSSGQQQSGTQRPLKSDEALGAVRYGSGDGRSVRRKDNRFSDRQGDNSYLGRKKTSSRRGDRRRWFEDPKDFDDEDTSLGGRTSHPSERGGPHRESSPDIPATNLLRSDADDQEASPPPRASTGEALDSGNSRQAQERHFVLGGDVVEGYVSLGPKLNHRASGDDDAGGGGLLLAGPPVEDEEPGGEGNGVCGGAGLSKFREQLYEEGRFNGNLATRLLDRYYLPALFSRGGKAITLVVAAGIAILGCFGLAGLRMGLEPQLAAPTDFYLQEYYEAQFSLGEAGPPAYVVFTDIDYFKAFNDSDFRQTVSGVSTGLAELQRYVQAPIYSWFDTMAAWVNQKDTLAADCPSQITIQDETSFYSMVELFLSIPIESQCCQSYGVCGAQFETDVVFDEFNLQPLSSQRDFVNSYYYIKVVTDQLADKIPERYEGQRKKNKRVGNLAFPYSVYFVFYEQYAFIQGVAIQNIALALAVVFLSISALSGFAIAAMVTALVLGTTLGTVGLVWAWGQLSSAPYEVSINAVSVCNLVMSLGLSVEFCLHVAVAFQSVPGTRQERAEAAMKSAGASVMTGITFTKLVGVSVLAIAPSLLFRIYYFRMYMATVLAGAFEGLAVLPVLLSMCGPRAPPSVLMPKSPWSPELWSDKHDDMAPFMSPLHTELDEHGSGYQDLGGGTPGGALGWNWRGSVRGGWDSWDDRDDDDDDDDRDVGRKGLRELTTGSGKGLALAPASHVRANDSLVQ